MKAKERDFLNKLKKNCVFVSNVATAAFSNKFVSKMENNQSKKSI